jgi:hypothetical protein
MCPYVLTCYARTTEAKSGAALGKSKGAPMDWTAGRPAIRRRRTTARCPERSTGQSNSNHWCCWMHDNDVSFDPNQMPDH